MYRQRTDELQRLQCGCVQRLRCHGTVYCSWSGFMPVVDTGKSRERHNQILREHNSTICVFSCQPRGIGYSFVHGVQCVQGWWWSIGDFPRTTSVRSFSELSSRYWICRPLDKYNTHCFQFSISTHRRRRTFWYIQLSPGVDTPFPASQRPRSIFQNTMAHVVNER